MPSNVASVTGTLALPFDVGELERHHCSPIFSRTGPKRNPVQISRSRPINYRSTLVNPCLFGVEKLRRIFAFGACLGTLIYKPLWLPKWPC